MTYLPENVHFEHEQCSESLLTAATNKASVLAATSILPGASLPLLNTVYRALVAFKRLHKSTNTRCA